MARIIFQQISDSRFSDNIVTEIERLKNKTDEAIEKIGAKNIGSGIFNFIDFKDGTQQYRVDYIIEKEKCFTYNQLFEAVNSVKAVPYTIKRAKIIKI